jgi:hypothetical protein
MAVMCGSRRGRRLKDAVAGGGTAPVQGWVLDSLNGGSSGLAVVLPCWCCGSHGLHREWLSSKRPSQRTHFMGRQ